MSEPTMPFVKVYDFATQQTTPMPAAELAPGMIKVQLKGSDEAVWVDGAQLRPGPICQPPFEGALRAKIERIHQVLAEVQNLTFEEWEDGFRRDHEPEGEIQLWLWLCSVYEEYCASRVTSSDQRHEAFRVLVSCLCGSDPGEVRDLLQPQALDRATVEELVDRFVRKRQGR